MKRLILALCLLLPAALAPARTPAPFAEEGLFPRVTLDHPDGRYRAGEEIVFHCDAREPVSLRLEVLFNGIRSKEYPPREVQIPAGRSVLFRMTPQGPLSVIVRLTRPDRKGRPSDTGAVAEAEGFRPRMPLPADMQEFWAREKERMRAEPMQPRLQPAAVPEADSAAFEASSLEINCMGGAPVRGYLVRPRAAAKGSLPVVLFLHSAGVEKPGNRASVAQALRYARQGRGAIALDINAHGYPDDMPQAYYDSLAAGPLKGYLIRSAETHDAFYYHGMFLRAQRALDYLCSLPEWDGKRVMVVGMSQGGAQAAAMAGMDERVTAAVLNEPGFIDVAVVPEPDRRSCTPRFLEKYGADDPVLKLLPYYDAANFLRFSRAAIWMEVGLVDFTCPPACVLAGFNVCPSEQKTLVTFPYRAHGSVHSMTEGQARAWRRSVQASQDRFIADFLQ